MAPGERGLAGKVAETEAMVPMASTSSQCDCPASAIIPKTQKEGVASPLIKLPIRHSVPLWEQLSNTAEDKNITAKVVRLQLHSEQVLVLVASASEGWLSPRRPLQAWCSA
jgi:hypothetical protein